MVMKIFINGFWGEPNKELTTKNGSTKGLLLPITILLILSIAYGLGVEWLSPYISQAADTLLDPTIYIQAVLKE
jgi:multicomponent Na+:H+ antiporter subunit D